MDLIMKPHSLRESTSKLAGFHHGFHQRIFRKNMDFTGENADPCYQIGKFSRAKWGCFSNADFGVARQVFGHDEGGPMEAGQ